jgi:AcrR family transcriptional regulator
MRISLNEWSFVIPSSLERRQDFVKNERSFYAVRVPRVSEQHLAARRQQILDAARTCFLRNGLHTTSMQDLIREADLSVGAVYRYFSSKNEIINAIAEEVAGGLAAAFGAIFDEEPALPLPEAMSRALAAMEGQIAINFPLAVQVWGEATLDPAIGAIVAQRYLGLRETFARLARRARDRGELAADADIDGVAAALLGMIPGYALQRLLLGTPDQQTYAAGVRALLAGPPRTTEGA